MSSTAKKGNPSSQTTAALQQGESLFRALIEHSLDALALISRDGIFMYVSPSIEKMSGCLPEELVGCHMSELFPPEYLTVALERFEAIQNRPGFTVTIEHPQLHKDGTLRWIETSLTNHLDTPAIQACVANFHDITKRKSTQDQLHLSEQRYRTLIEQSPLSIQVFSPDGTTILVNRAWEQLWGVTLQQIGRYNILEDEQLVAKGIMPLVKRGFAGEVTALPAIKYEPDQTIPQMSSVRYRWVRAILYPVKDETDQIREMVLIHEDITDRKDAEGEVRKAKEQLEAILFNAADGITVQDASGGLVYVNDAAATLSGFPSAEAMLNAPPEALRQAIQRFIMKNEEGIALPIEELPGRRVLRGEKRVQAVIQYVDSLTGQIRWSLVKAQPIFSEDGQVQFAVNVFTDITERQALEERKNALISMASHELKTPVTSLKGFTKVLQRRFKKTEDTQTLHFLARMDSQLNNLTKLISELLDVTKMQSGQLSFAEKPFDLAALVDETVENLQAGIASHHLHIVATEHARVVGDQDRIGQVLINLVENAVKYSPRANAVILRLSTEEGQARVSVQDFGIGIAQAYQQRIFEQFYQVTDPEERTYPGLGIGLYIANEIIKRHGGRLWVESRKGEGATFCFTLPLAVSPE